MEKRFIIGAIVANHFGVLNRVAGLFAKRGYNIDSLVVGETDNPEFSRMTIVATGDKYVEEQVVKQLLKLYDVKIAKVLEQDSSVMREHMLVKLNVTSDDNGEITNVMTRYGGKVVDFSKNSITVELTGDVDKNDRFIEKVKAYGIIEICRAGALAMSRGTEYLAGDEND